MLYFPLPLSGSYTNCSIGMGDLITGGSRLNVVSISTRSLDMPGVNFTPALVK